MYRTIFNNEFNISFHTPKKDMCHICIAYNNATIEEKEKLQEEFQEHMRNKELSHQEMADDVKRVQQEGTGKLSVSCYDLQQVLQCPYQLGNFYYLRKLSVYN